MHVSRAKVLKALRSAPQLRSGDSFEPIADCVGAVSAAYLDYLRRVPVVELESYMSDPSDRGASERKYQVSWCNALAKAIADCFACKSILVPYGTQAVFYGEALGARCAGALYAHAVSEIDRYAPSEYVRRYKRATYHGQKPQYGWRKNFIREGISQIRAQAQRVRGEARIETQLLQNLEKIEEWAEKAASIAA